MATLPLLLAACAAAAQLPPGVKAVRDLVYAQPGGRPLHLDLYLPEQGARPLPVVVWIYGGAWRAGSKDDGQTRGALWLTEHGYAVAAFNYRLSQTAKFPAQIHDAKAAVRWLRRHADEYGLDPQRIAAWGASAGGHLAALLGVTAGVPELEGPEYDPRIPARVQAVIDFYGPTDFLQMDAHALPGGMKHDPADSPESQLIGGPIQENPEKVRRANPAAYVTPDAAPFLILHGERDPLVPVHQSELLFEALKKAGVPVVFHKIAGAGHGGPEFQNSVARAMVLAFLDGHLRRRAAEGER
ncbi:MAG: alpha/beta hydrolase [Bryobacteraceae bacterium]|nr:alpha/beta hydrolase [Bryobacteraceae bacterium]